MAKSTTARRRLAGTAPTPEELADDAPWRDENGQRIPPKPEPEFARKVNWVLGHDNLLDTLGKGEWLPRTPEDIATALRILGEEGSANLIFREEAPDQLDKLKRRNAELEARIARLERDLLQRDYFDTKINELLQAVTSNG